VPAVVLVSAKGSPGVTTAAAALAAVATTAGGALLVELDPSGGSVQVLTGEPAVAGLVDAAGNLRRQPSAAAIEGTTTPLPAGMRTLLAPSSGQIAESVIASAGDRWLPALGPCAPDVLVDGGRWEPSQRTARRVAGADLVVVVCRPTVPGVESTRHVLERLREQARRPVAAVVVGDRPYPPEQIAAHLDVPLAGTISWDPRGATSLWVDGPSRRWLRTVLARSAAATLAGLAALADGVAPPYGAPPMLQGNDR
jgi:Flp pilus assembly CpaE family ATPase